MNSTWLYGIEVKSHFPLFEAPTFGTASAPGEHAAITLAQRVRTAHPGGTPGRVRTAHHETAYRDTNTHLTQQLAFELTHGRELTLLTDRPLADATPGQPWRLDVENVVTFDWQSSENHIEFELLTEGTLDLVAFWFTHIVLPLYLTLERGYDFLHAAAVEVDGAPVLFVAPSTGGKSTLADYFLKQGHALFSDDKVATFLHGEQYWAAPSHPHHRPWREFEVLGQPVAMFARQANPIRAVYCLQAEDPLADIAIEEVLGFRKFEELLPNYLFNFDYLRVRRLAWLGRMAGTMPVYRVHRPWDLARLQETYVAVIAHAAKR